MGWIIFSIILFVGAIIGLGFTKDTVVKKDRYGEHSESQIVFKRNNKQFLALLALLLIIPSFLVSIPTGHTAIVTSFGKVSDKTMEAGINTKLPWEKVINIDNRVQTEQFNLLAFSKDIQEVNTTTALSYQLSKSEAHNIYKNIGTGYFNKIIIPRMKEVLKNVIAQYDAEQIINSRAQLSNEITETLRLELDDYGINVVSLSIEDIDFSDAFTNAVEAKAVAAQTLLKAKTEQEQKTMEEQQMAARQKIQADSAAEVAKIQAAASADVARIEAEAEAEVLRIQADAAEYAGQKDAAINKALTESLTEILIQYYEIQQWDGKLPETVIGSDGTVLPIINTEK